MYCIGTDIGSSCAKAAVLSEGGDILYLGFIPTGWSGAEAAQRLRSMLSDAGYDPYAGRCVATGYGRNVTGFAHKTVTEISCHAAGAARLFGLADFDVIDIGGQDTKVINVRGGAVRDFLMNDKCSAGTGRFIEVMASRLGMSSEELISASARGSGASISSMCTVFAESEVISLIGRGERPENIAFAVVDSISRKIASQAARLCTEDVPTFLTGGFCDAQGLISALAGALGRDVASCGQARYAGAIGAALAAARLRPGLKGNSV